MKITANDVVVHGYGVYQKNPREGGGPMTRGDGSPVEYVEIIDNDSIAVRGGERRFTLHPTINGNRPKVGTTVNMIMADFLEPDAKLGAGNRPYVTQKRKNVVTDLMPV